MPQNATKSTRKRLAPEERKKQIIAAAIELFSEHGFESSTHQLAQKLGVTQPLIYRHFPTKDELIKAVYERVYLNEWKASWDLILSDRSRPLEDRLCQFYLEYTAKIFETEWIRIYLHAGLRRLEINRWYMSLVEDRVLGRIASELREEFDLPDPQTVPISDPEIEALWLLHGGIFYYGVRSEVYDSAPRVDRTEAVKIHAKMTTTSMLSIMSLECSMESTD